MLVGILGHTHDVTWLGRHQDESHLSGVAQYPQAAVMAVKAALTKHGITSASLQASILATISKESGFVPKSEFDYTGTANDRLRKIFPSIFNPRNGHQWTDAEMTALKQKGTVAFYDVIYGGKFGNTSPGDGYKYRGRGFNGITFKDEYRYYGQKAGLGDLL